VESRVHERRVTQVAQHAGRRILLGLGQVLEVVQVDHDPRRPKGRDELAEFPEKDLRLH
jgi:hypothetical protein